MRIKHIKTLRSCLAVLLLLVLPWLIFADSVEEQTLTRGKLWYSTVGVNMVVQTGGRYEQFFSYPGFFESFDLIRGIQKWGPMWIVDGVEVLLGTGDRGLVSFADGVVPNELHTNYNFTGEGGVGFPEEWTYAETEYFEMSQVIEGRKQGKVMVINKDMCWSVPKYDDFIISEVTVTNNDDETIEGLYWPMAICLRHRLGFKNDKEFIWDEDRQTFIFYDDTSWPVKDAAPIEYLISPGTETGDVGDPGNITTIGSLDRRLYSPQLMMFNFVNVTPNRDGEAKVWHCIFSSDEDAQDKLPAPGTPENERFVGWDHSFAELLQQITKEEERNSWLDMWNDPANPRDGTVDGSLYERTPFYYISVGPYDLEPGESVSWTYIMCLGEMDRNISQLGGLNSTTQVKDKGLENILDNYDVALELIANNYQLPNDEYPPPTCGTPPYVISDNNKLEVAEFSEVVDGAASQGFELSWLAVPADYTDPGTGEADFAGYKIYSSEIHITGPWEEIRNLTAAEAEPYRDGDQIVYRVEVEPGIPYRFAVTSYDTHGLESGMTAYTFFAEAAKRAPSNQMSTIKVIPNPFRQTSGLLDPGESDRIAFVNIPAQCTIRIYTLAGDLVKDIEHDGLGEVSWGQSDNDTYMLTNFGSAVAPGLYIYHIESHVAGNEGETHIGKFMIIN